MSVVRCLLSVANLTLIEQKLDQVSVVSCPESVVLQVLWASFCVLPVIQIYFRFLLLSNG